MCLGSNKKNPATACEGQAFNYFLSDTICARHLAERKLEVSQDHPFEDSMLSDYAMLWALMDDSQKFKACLTQLAKEVGARAPTGPKSAEDERDDRLRWNPDGGFRNVRLSRALSYYEQFCYFPDYEANFAGLLTAAGFEWSLRNGVMPKDPGAGLKHGDFSHRLQWNVVMRGITADFKVARREPWNHSPLQLFTSLGAPPATDVNLWYRLFDNNSNGLNFHNPDNVQSACAKDQALQILHSSLTSRATKRKALEDSAGEAITAMLESTDELLPLRTMYHNRDYGVIRLLSNGRVAGIVYHWKKTGRPNKTTTWLNGYKYNRLKNLTDKRFHTLNMDDEKTRNYVEEFCGYLAERVAYDLWDKLGLQYVAKFYSMATNNEPGNAGAPVEGVLMKSRDAGENIQARIAASANSLNQEFQRNERVGVVKR
jgi:hypothetical protein